MTVLLAVVIYVIALLVVLILVGGTRRGDELNAKALRNMRNATRAPSQTPRPEHFGAPWSKVPEKPEPTSAGAPGRSAARS